MAVFNPETQVPDDPYYLNLSKGVDVPQQKSILASGISGIGDVIDVALKGTDAVIKNSISDELRTSVDTERNKLTGALETVTGVPGDERVGTPTAPITETNPSLMPSPDQPIPDGLASDLKRADRINQAKLQNETASEYYYSKLIDKARGLRDKWGEGYWKTIDEEMSAMVGGNPANMYVAKLMQNWVDLQKQGSDDRDKIKTFIRGHVGEYSGAEKIYEDYNAGKINDIDVMKWAAEQAKPSIRVKGLLNEQSEKNITLDKAKDQANETFTKSLDELLQAQWNTAMKVIGYKPEQAEDIARRIQAGENVPGWTDNPDNLVRMGNAIKGLAIQYERQGQQLAGTKIPGYQWNIDMAIGTQEVQAKIKAQSKALHDLSDLFLNEKTGAAFQHANELAGLMRNKEYSLYTDVNLGDALQLSTIISKNSGLGAQYIMSVISPELHMGDKIGSYLNGGPQVKELILQSRPNETKTLKSIIDRLTDDPNTKEDPGLAPAVKKVMDIPKIILDPKVPDWEKVNIIKGSLSSANTGMLARVKDDYIDTKTGQPVPGQHTIFANTTNAKMLDEVWRLSQGNSQLWESAKIWMDKEREPMVGQDVKDLNSTFLVNPNIKLHWDTNGNKFYAEYPSRTQATIDPRGPDFRNQQLQTERLLAKINSTIPSITYVAKKEGTDPNAAVLRTFMGYGMDPNQPAVAKMLGALAAGAKKPKDAFEGAK